MSARRDPFRPPAVPGLELRLTGEDRYQPTLQQLGLFFSDLSILFELYRKVGTEVEPDTNITRFDLYRNAVRVAPEERLWLRGVRMESPLEMTILTGIVLSNPRSIEALLKAVWGLRDLVHLPADVKRRGAEADQAVADVARIEAEAEKLRADARLVNAQAHKAEIEAQRLQRDDETARGEISRAESRAIRRLLASGDVEPAPKRLLRDEDAREVIERVRLRVLEGPVSLTSLVVNSVSDISNPPFRGVDTKFGGSPEVE